VLDPSRFLAFALTALIVIVVPGPSVLFVIGRGVALGRRAALTTVVANAAGVYVLVLVVAAGLGPWLERSETLLVGVKLAGAAYLIFLGLKAIRDRRDLHDALGAPLPPSSTRTILREGFTVGVLNPKAALFFAAILPQFVVAGALPVPVQIAALGLVFVLIALISDSVWAVLAGTARERLAGNPRRLEAIGAAGGGVLVVLGVRMALTARAP
jgi:threonine/homoserine/homoserine lactone efflux protein